MIAIFTSIESFFTIFSFCQVGKGSIDLIGLTVAGVKFRYGTDGDPAIALLLGMVKSYDNVVDGMADAEGDKARVLVVQKGRTVFVNGTKIGIPLNREALNIQITSVVHPVGRRHTYADDNRREEQICTIHLTPTEEFTCVKIFKGCEVF